MSTGVCFYLSMSAGVSLYLSTPAEVCMYLSVFAEASTVPCLLGSVHTCLRVCWGPSVLLFA